jgi:hypothetical protein
LALGAPVHGLLGDEDGDTVSIGGVSRDRFKGGGLGNIFADGLHPVENEIENSGIFRVLR